VTRHRLHDRGLSLSTAPDHARHLGDFLKRFFDTLDRLRIAHKTDYGCD
jgi:hypothetical protein